MYKLLVELRALALSETYNFTETCQERKVRVNVVPFVKYKNAPHTFRIYVPCRQKEPKRRQNQLLNFNK